MMCLGFLWVYREGLPAHLWRLPLSQSCPRSPHLQRGMRCWQALIETNWTSQIQSSEGQGELLRPLDFFLSPTVRAVQPGMSVGGGGALDSDPLFETGMKLGNTEKNKSSTFVAAFPSPGFPLCEASWWDGSSAPSEDPPSSSLAETVESSENLRALGAGGAWDEMKQRRFTRSLTDGRAHVHMTSHSEPKASLGRSLPAGEGGSLPRENAWTQVKRQAQTRPVFISPLTLRVCLSYNLSRSESPELEATAGDKKVLEAPLRDPHTPKPEKLAASASNLRAYFLTGSPKNNWTYTPEGSQRHPRPTSY